MFFIYSLEGEKVKLYDTCNTKTCIINLIRNCAVNFIRFENGDARANDAFKDDVLDKDITEDRYYLRLSSENVDQINVFKRTTIVVPGTIYGATTTVKYEKVMIFGVIEASVGLPIEHSNNTVVKPVFDNARQEEQFFDVIEELKKHKLFKRD